MHFMTVSLAVAGKGLGTMWGRELAIEMLTTGGFTNVEVKQLEHHFQNEYFFVDEMTYFRSLLTGEKVRLREKPLKEDSFSIESANMF